MQDSRCMSPQGLQLTNKDSGQGGGQSIEDAGALGVLFTNIESSSDVLGRLEAFERMRYRRASAIQILSNAGQDQVYKVQEKARKYIDGDVPGEYFYCNRIGSQCMTLC